MPTYQYACTACGHSFEIAQRFSDDSLEHCPVCEGRLRKVFNAVGVVFKGSGFYRTDSRKAEAGAKADGGGADGGRADGGTSDGGKADGGTSDGGKADGGTSDGGKGKSSGASTPAASGSSGSSGSSSSPTSGSKGSASTSG